MDNIHNIQNLFHSDVVSEGFKKLMDLPIPHLTSASQTEEWMKRTHEKKLPV